MTVLSFSSASRARTGAIAFAVLGATALLAPRPARAITLAEQLTFDAGASAGIVMGQSVTTPGGGPFNTIAFNFFGGGTNNTPLALGTLFLLTSAYTGTPAALSAATPGFVAQSVSNAGGIYTFASAVTLQANTQYFFYANTGNASSTNFSTVNPYAGGNLSLAAGTGNSFTNQPTADAAFRLTGNVAAPEPASVALLGVGVAGLALRRRR